MNFSVTNIETKNVDSNSERLSTTNENDIIRISINKVKE